MTFSLRRIALLSFTAIATLSLAPAAHLLTPFAGKTLLASAAFAKDGGHGSGGEHSGGESGGRGGEASGHDGGDDSGSDSDSDSDSDSSDDHGSDKGKSSDDSATGSTDDSADDDSTDDSSSTHEDNGRRRHGNETARAHADDNSRVAISVSDSALAGLKDGSLKAVDNLGRTLEVEIEQEHGTVKVEVKAHGDDDTPITGVSIVPAT